MSNGRCRLHGGKSLKGAQSPQYKSGRFSRYLPQHLQERAEAILTDPDLHSLNEAIGLVRLRITDLLERSGVGETGENWRRAQELTGESLVAISRFRAALREGDEATITSAFTDIEQRARELDQLARVGVGDFGTWETINKELDLLRRLTDSETKRLKDLNTMMSAEQVMILMTAIADEVRIQLDRHLDDPALIDRILQDTGAGVSRYLNRSVPMIVASNGSQRGD